MIRLDMEDERTIRSAADQLYEIPPPDPHLRTCFFAGGILLNPEKQSGDLDLAIMQKTFKANICSHLSFMKHFTARMGSIGGSRKGGRYSYRAPKATLNQAMHTFDFHLEQTKRPAMAVVIHPGTMKTDLSKDS